MQRLSASLLALLALAPAAAGERLAGTPIDRVTALIRDVGAKIEADGVLEQQSYDKYACWCEATLGRKASDISASKEQIVSLEASIKELGAAVASHGAEVKQLKSDIAANVESQREAREARSKEAKEYNEEKSESEQCIGALEAAIKVLTGAGSGARGFLQNLKEAQLLSVVAGVRGLLRSPTAERAVSREDLEVVQRFVDKPEDFAAGRAGGVSAAQLAQNPFGDYAPQSTQIQGILKGMYDAFAADLERANAEESDQQKAFEALMATKQQELNTLQKTLEKQSLDKAQKAQKAAENVVLLDDTKVQLEADERFFATTREACQVKATEWSERTRLRTEELQGVRQAIEVLSGPEAQQVFLNATTTLLQVSSSRKPGAAYAQLKALAKRFKSVSFAEMAVAVKAGGHFDKVIVSIDKMISVLRAEEQADIYHRDRCQNAEKKNSNDAADLNHAIDKSGKAIARMNTEATELNGKITSLEAQIKQTKDDMAAQLSMRNSEAAAFVRALKDDTDAISLIETSIVLLSRFYRNNRIPMALLHTKRAPEYTVDPNKAPETIWKGANYAGQQSETQGLVAILEMIKEDLQREVQVAREEEGKAQAEYVKGRAAAQEVLDAQNAEKVATEKSLAELEGRTLDMEEYKGQKTDDLDAENLLTQAIYSDCSWVPRYFQTRRDKRKDEIDGLEQAKAYLAGVEDGSQLAP